MNTRGVSTTVNYVMTLGITTLLVIGLLVATGTYVEGHQEQTERMELTVVGQQLVGTLSSADGLAQSVDDGDFTVERDLPESVARKPYTVRIAAAASSGQVNVTLATDDVEVTVEMTNRTDVEPVELTGGDVEIRFDSATDELVVDDA